jgi:hypothetical protein
VSGTPVPESCELNIGIERNFNILFLNSISKFRAQTIPMTVSSTSTTRFLSIRLSTEEYAEVYQHLQQSTCRSLTEYVKKVLTSKPVTVKIRDQSREEILQQLTLIKSRLETLVDKTSPADAEHLFQEVADIKSTIRQIAEKCSPS